MNITNLDIQVLKHKLARTSTFVEVKGDFTQHQVIYARDALNVVNEWKEKILEKKK